MNASSFLPRRSPASDRNSVRLKLARPQAKHTYYAKIEFYPRRPVSAGVEEDPAAEKAVDAIEGNSPDAVDARGKAAKRASVLRNLHIAR